MTSKNTGEINYNSGARIFLECPDEVPGIQFGEPVQAELERTVVVSDFFGKDLPQNSILVQHKCWFRPVLTPVKVHLTLAQVAGYRKAVYGLPEKYYPVLFQHPEYPNIMISTTKLSSFAEGRFAPFCDWKIVMGRLKAWLNGKNGIEEITCSPAVYPAFKADERLPGNAEETAFNASVKWFNNNMFFEQGDKIGVCEGYASGIQPSGRQSLRPALRCDCTGESAMIPAFDWAVNKNYPARKTSLQIMDYLFNSGKLADTDPASPTYGGLYFYENLPVFYAGDNSRASISCILASELTDNFDFVPNVLRCLLSLLRSTGKNGFRHNRLDNPCSFTNGQTWKDYQNEDLIEYRPHYQSSMWCAYLQAYVLTGHQEFFDKAKKAISMTMEIFPEVFWQNGITGEYARMLLPLAFLIQIEDTPQHRAWLRFATEKLLESIEPCGAIRELMGSPKFGKYPAPHSNEEYGTTEASLIQRNGDPCCDLIYTMNYAFIGLHESSIATGEKFYVNNENKIADFLCRIQLKSKAQPYLEGCWMHGFDFDLWEYFASSADNGWGAWCVESGWTNTWISTTFALRKLNRGLLCRENAEIYRRTFPEIYEEMQIVHKNFTPKPPVQTIVPGAE